MEYPGYFARFYDVIYRHVRSSTDTDFYLNKIKSCNGSVLEVGVGTGRFFSRALEEGADIYGIDISPEMVDVLKSKIQEKDHFRVTVQDICTFRSDREFDLIIAPFRVMSHVISISDQLAALQNISRHLSDGGFFIFDLFVPNLKMLAEGIDNVIDFEGEFEPGRILKRYSGMKADLINQISDVNMKFIWDENGTEVAKEWGFKLRFYFRWEIEHLIARSPLKLVEIFGGFPDEKLSASSKEFIVVCQK